MEIEQKISYNGICCGTHEIVTGRSYNYMDYPALPIKDDNICSTTYDNDRELAAMLNMEKWNMFGVKINYFKTTYDVKKDKVFGEDTNRHIITQWDIMSYFQLPKENKVWSKFGIEGINNFSMYISKIHFTECTKSDYHPKIGDLILTPYNNVLYEIVDVRDEAPMFLLSKQYTWELVVKRAKIENELSVSPLLSASPITQFYDIDDMFDITNDIDIEKEDIIYNPEPGEQPNKDPFGNW